MRTIIYNLILGVVLIALPLCAELVAALRGERPGAGIDLAFYWPTHHALFLLAALAFLCLNVQQLRRQRGGVALGVLAGLLATLTWVPMTVVVVLQVHIWRGGQL